MLASSTSVRDEFTTNKAVLAPKFTQKRDQNPQIWNLDNDPSILSINCSSDFTKLFIRHSNVINQWRSSDVLSGSTSWGCTKHNIPHTILVEIIDLNSTNDQTIVKCKELQLTDVFQDLSFNIKSSKPSSQKITPSSPLPKGILFIFQSC